MQYSPQQLFSKTYPSQQQSQPFYDPMQTHGNITVNPIIKIVNGDDKSSGTIESGSVPSDQQNGSIGHTPMIITKKSNEDEDDAQNSKKNGGGISNNQVDFSQPMIVIKI